MPALRTRSCCKPNALSSSEPNSIAPLKLSTSPATIRAGRRVPAVSTTGSTHGEMLVTTPASRPDSTSVSLEFSPRNPAGRLAHLRA